MTDANSKARASRQTSSSPQPSPKPSSSDSPAPTKPDGKEKASSNDPEYEPEALPAPTDESESVDKATSNESTDGDGGPLVDMETFGQLLEMDDDEDHTFSKSLTWDYFDQAVTTFNEMDAAVVAGDLITLSRKGHFLKGSSAALGLNKVKASCEKMQHYGNKKKANGEGTLSEAEAMEQCKALLEQLKEEQKLSKAWLERFYAERNV